MAPGPRGSFLGGNLEAYERDRLGFLSAVARTYGPVATFDRTTAVISDPALAREVLDGLDGAAVIRNNVLQEPIATQDLNSWPVARRLINPSLRAKAVQRRSHRLDELAETHLRGRPAGTHDVMAFWQEYTAAAAADFLLGPDSARVPELTAELLASLPAVVGNVFALPAWIPTRGRRNIRRHFETLRSHLMPMLEARSSHPDRFDDGAGDMIRRATRMRPSPTLDRIANAVIGNLLASHTVPAAGLAWTLHHLQETPSWKAAVEEELLACATTPTSEGEQTTEARPRTTAAILEATRLLPPTWLITRQLIRPATLGGYGLPTGTTLMLSPYVLHRDPNSFSDASAYSPGRWLGPDHAKLAPVYFAFGAGPRNCPGRDFAMASTTAALSCLVRHHRWQLDGDATPDPRFTLQPRSVTLTLSPR